MRITFNLLALLISITAFSQNYKFGKVSKEELQEVINPIDSSATASYLYKNRKTHFQYLPQNGFNVVTEVHERVKIYNQEGYEYATKQIALYKSRNNEEEVSGLKAYTYNLIDGKIIEDKMSKDAVFKTETSKYWDQLKFTLPNIKNGCIVEYRYKIFSPFITNIDEYVFQEDIPIKKLEAVFEAPEYFVYKKNVKGYLPVTPKTERLNDKFVYHGVSNNTGEAGTSSVKKERYTQEVTHLTNKTSYDLLNIPALKEEPYVSNIDNYRSGVKYELSYTHYPNSSVDYYSTTWEDVVKTIYESSSFGDELDKSGYYEKDIDALIGSISDPVKRAYLIFDFVKSRMKWNNYHSFYTNQGVKSAYKDHVGNVAEINLMLTSMLRYAGLRAYPVLVSTRSHGIPIFPTREGYNYVVSCIRFPEGDMLLDATNKYAVPNVLPTKALNWQGRMISEHGGSTLIDLYPKEKSKNTIFMMAKLKEDGSIEGACRTMKTTHKALEFRENYIGVNLDDYLERLENKYDGMEISDYAVKNDLDLSQPVRESYKFVKENQADIIGDKIYFSPMFFLRDTQNPFKLENREYPVDFAYPSVTSCKIIVSIPEGYKIESIPEAGAFMMPDDLGLFKYNILPQGNKVQLAVETHISESVITPVYYAALKTYFSQLVDKQGEQIVLSRI
ncbi:DUF3857 domain-containing protein [Tamlana agarivorans]|uniref:DUF3857 domain-containing protein n=1 Tax=Pseudotamlana agarivorans TaxID=481183 RepID=A0ACC5U4A7_9FLAO|nr:DUF3857 domain-containing protein [Tamlana agarivorans]MBU2949131.1 DUF3857 domain-containing protein [Tamlana agarivorans]